MIKGGFCLVETLFDVHCELPVDIGDGIRIQRPSAAQSEIIAAMTCGPKVAAYTSPTPSMPQVVRSFRKTKYRPPKPGGGLPTTKTLTLSNFMVSPVGRSVYNDRGAIASAHFCATMMVGALVLPEVMLGNTDASMTRSRSIPCTRKAESTTESAAVGPIRQVPTG